MTLEILIPIISTGLVAIANILLVWLTFRYVRETRVMANEMKTSREPAIYLDFEFPNGHDLLLVVQNFGESAALDLKVTYTDNLKWVRSRMIEVPIFTNGISYLTPGRKLIFSAGHLDWKYTNKNGGVVEFNLSYLNESRDQFNRSIIFNFSQYKGVHFKSYKDIGDKISESVKDFSQDQSFEKRLDRIRIPFMSGGLKNCPVCDEEISEDARKCPKCLEFIEEK